MKHILREKQSLLNEPSIDVFIPVYNGDKYIEKTIQSLLAQTYHNYRIVVVDNQSTDNTIRIVKRICLQYDNIELLVNEKNLGGEGNFNKCFTLVKADLFCIYHADDMYEKDILERCATVFNDNSIHAVSTMGSKINEKDEHIGSFFLPKNLLKMNSNIYTFDNLYSSLLENGNSFLICPSVMMRKSIKEHGWNFEYKKFQSASDVGLWLKIAKVYKFFIINEKLIKYRIHSQQGSVTCIYNRTSLPDIFKVIDYYKKTFTFNDESKIFYYNFKAKEFLKIIIKKLNNKMYSESELVFRAARYSLIISLSYGVHIRTMYYIGIYFILRVAVRIKRISNRKFL